MKNDKKNSSDINNTNKKKLPAKTNSNETNNNETLNFNSKVQSFSTNNPENSQTNTSNTANWITSYSYRISPIKQVLIAGLLLATSIVFSRFLAIKTPILKISFAFIPNMLCGIILGPWWGMCVAGLTDLIGALLFPFGAYFVGYTITATLSGFIYGLFLQKKYNKTNKRFIINLIIAILLVLVICNSVLNTLWLHITAKKAFFVLLPTRLLKQLIMLPIEIITMFSINLGLEKLGIFKMLYEPIDDDENYDAEIEDREDNNDFTNDETNETNNIKENTTKQNTEKPNRK